MSADLAEAQAAVAQAPRDAGAWNRLGLILIGTGRFDQAEDSLARAVALDPASVEARNNLGVAQHRLGRLETACETYAEVLAMDPNNVSAHGNLAAGLGELGRLEGSLEHARAAIARQPAMPGPWVYAALAEAGLGRRETALHCLDHAIALAAPNAQLLVQRADLLRELGRCEEGLRACRQALALEPANGRAENSLGLLNHALGLDEQAIAAFDRAAGLLSAPAQALANKTIVLLEVGRREEGLASLDAALAADGALAAGWSIRADTRTFAAGDPDIETMEVLARSARPEADQLLLHYALGKAYLDVRDPPRAFAHLHQGAGLKRAALKRAGQAYDIEAALSEMTAIAEAFPASRFARAAPVDETSEAPVFILGMPRSGTTLIEQILASHPQIHGDGESPRLGRLVSELGGACPRDVAALAPDRIAALGQAYLAMAGPPKPGAVRVIDKAPGHFLHAGLIRLALPKARLIHCRRHPADTGLSCYSKLFRDGQEFSYDLVELGRYWRGYAALMDHWRAVLPAEQFIEVDYEAVVNDLEGQARRLIGFCGLDWDEACLRFHETPRTVRTASVNQVRRPLYRGGVGRWEGFREQLAPLLQVLGEDATPACIG